MNVLKNHASKWFVDMRVIYPCWCLSRWWSSYITCKQTFHERCCRKAGMHNTHKESCMPKTLEGSIRNIPFVLTLVWTPCLMHRCVCIWRYILQNYNYKLHFKTSLYTTLLGSFWGNLFSLFQHGIYFFYTFWHF